MAYIFYPVLHISDFGLLLDQQSRGAGKFIKVLFLGVKSAIPSVRYLHNSKDIIIPHLVSIIQPPRPATHLVVVAVFNEMCLSAFKVPLSLKILLTYLIGSSTVPVRHPFLWPPLLDTRGGYYGVDKAHWSWRN